MTNYQEKTQSIEADPQRTSYWNLQSRTKKKNYLKDVKGFTKNIKIETVKKTKWEFQN